MLFIHYSLFIVLLSGCFPKGTGLDTQFVEGTITLDGNPCEKVSITFIPKTAGSGEGANGISGTDGRYILSSLSGDAGKGALAGDYIVLASKSEAVELAKPKIGPSGDPITSELKPVLPEIYRNEQKTPLSATVVKGKNKIDFALESSPKK
ncbi:hypothetical protein FACS189427_13550 [Planctomycetales bacterium]|nr:hypothetical protein FACS189427_13550 [Planctomycetales bacterium]